MDEGKGKLHKRKNKSQNKEEMKHEVWEEAKKREWEWRTEMKEKNSWRKWNEGEELIDRIRSCINCGNEGE